MKKIIYLLVFSLLLTTTQAIAKPNTKHNHNHHYHSSSSTSRIVVKTNYIDDEHQFQNCTDHSLVSNTIVTFYSDGTKHSYTRYTIKNKDGSILAEDCNSVKHVIHDKKHYFLFRKNKKSQIMDADGNIISSRNYKTLKEIAPNRILTCIDKKYGVINLSEEIITPIKYKSFEQVGKDLYLTKLNGYYGLMDCNNNTFVKNEYDSIKRKYDIFILKKEDKYGLANKEGQIIFAPKYNKIKVLGEYILIKDDKNYGVLDGSGNKIADIKYKKIKLDRNQLKGKKRNNEWENISTNI